MLRTEKPVGAGERIVHLDLHPGNVMPTPDGPVVIDWTNGWAGPASADVAMAYLIMASSDIEVVPSWLGPVARGLLWVFLSRQRLCWSTCPRRHNQHWLCDIWSRPRTEYGLPAAVPVSSSAAWHAGRRGAECIGIPASHKSYRRVT